MGRKKETVRESLIHKHIAGRQLSANQEAGLCRTRNLQAS